MPEKLPPSPETNEVTSLQQVYHEVIMALVKRGIIDVEGRTAEQDAAVCFIRDVTEDPEIDPELHRELNKKITRAEIIVISTLVEREVSLLRDERARKKGIERQAERREIGFQNLLERLSASVPNFSDYIDNIPYAASYLADHCISIYFLEGSDNTPVGNIPDKVLIELANKNLKKKTIKDELEESPEEQFLKRLLPAIEKYIANKKLDPTDKSLNAEYAIRDQERLDMVEDWDDIYDEIAYATKGHGSEEYGGGNIAPFIKYLKDIVTIKLTETKRLSAEEIELDEDLSRLEVKLNEALSKKPPYSTLTKEELTEIVLEHFHVFKLNIGNPGEFEQTPSSEMIQAVCDRITEMTGYKHQLGEKKYREKIAEFYNLYFQNKGAKMPEEFITRDNVIIGNGASEIIEMFILASLENSDNAVGISPIYPLYPAIMNMIGQDLNTVPLRCSDRKWEFKIGDLEASIDIHTKIIFLNSPHNPTGKVFDREEVEQVLDVAKKYNLFVISDEIYCNDIYDEENREKFCSVGELAYKKGVPVLLMSGISKGLGKAAGFRQGWGVLIDREGKATELFQAVNTLAAKRLCPNVPCQAAIGPIMDDLIESEKRRKDLQPGKILSLEGLETLKHLDELNRKTGEQRDTANEAFNTERLSMVTPEGAYYGFVKVEGIDNFKDEKRFAKEILAKRRIHLVPGQGFEYPESGYFRIVFLDNAENLRKAGAIVDEFAQEFIMAA